MRCRAPGPHLDALLEPWPAGRLIHVIHDSTYPPGSFNPGIRPDGAMVNPTRFAPIRSNGDTVVPYLYGGSSLECAIFETIFHHIPIDAADKFVDLAAYANRAHGRLTPARTLNLVNLTTDGLHRLRVPKAELIASPPSCYVETAAWSQALHRQFPNVDGLVWMSRQRDQDSAVMLFGDRVCGALKAAQAGAALRENEDLRQAILALALRVGIDVD